MILKQARGGPLPKAILEAPTLEPGLRLFYEAFRELNGSRLTDYGPIPWASIEEYCDRLELSDTQREDMHAHLRALDSTLSDHREREFNRKHGKSKGKRRGEPG